MKKILIIMSLLAVCLLAACAQTEQPPETTEPKETTSVSAYKSVGNYTKPIEMLSWEGINSFPIKSADMTIDEARSLCVDFFRYSKTALWVADADYKIYDTEGNVARTVDKGTVYGGLPYISYGSGNVYRTMDYMDPETGVVNVTAAGETPRLFGNQCSIASWWGWARVINSAKYSWTKNTTAYNNFIRLGDYTYDDNLEIFTKDYGTDEVIRETGMEKLFECYALLKKGDGILYYTTAGHAVMIATDAVVVRNEDGSINPTQSYVTVIDQGADWAQTTNASGDYYTYEQNVDAKWTFMSMFRGNYIPFTYEEFLGTDPIEDTEFTYSHTGDTITKDQLLGSSMTCNYSISDLYAMVYDEDGNEVLKVASRAYSAGRKKLDFQEIEAFKTVFTWGAWEDLSADKTYTVKVVAQLGTGERPTLWEGKLAQ